MRMSRNDLSEMAQNDPKSLLSIIKEQKLEPTCLTFAYEYLGAIKDKELWGEATEALVHGLIHDKGYVREGAIYGLQGLEYLGHEPARRVIERQLTMEKDKDLRDLIVDILEW